MEERLSAIIEDVEWVKEQILALIYATRITPNAVFFLSLFNLSTCVRFDFGIDSDLGFGCDFSLYLCMSVHQRSQK